MNMKGFFVYKSIQILFLHLILEEVLLLESMVYEYENQFSNPFWIYLLNVRIYAIIKNKCRYILFL